MKKKKEERFVQTHTEGSAFSIQKTILVDRETGVHYLFVHSGYGTSITPLLNADGTPVVHKIPDYEE